jgi:hypothetical protein
MAAGNIDEGHGTELVYHYQGGFLSRRCTKIGKFVK